MKISGKIVDASGQGLPGANVVKFGNNAVNTSADSNGNFILNSSNIVDFDNFKVSFVGYKPQIKSAKELQNTKITLLEDIETLDEVLITRKPKTPIAQSNTIATVKKYKTPLIVIGSLGLMALGFFLIKKVAI